MIRPLIYGPVGMWTKRALGSYAAISAELRDGSEWVSASFGILSKGDSQPDLRRVCMFARLQPEWFRVYASLESSLMTVSPSISIQSFRYLP